MMIKARTPFIALLFALSLVASGAWASEGDVHLDHANIDPHDNASIARGAQHFIDYCSGCHALSYMRYNRLAKDLGLSEKEVAKKMIFTGAKVGDTMKNALRKEDGKRWFGNSPPDLSVEVRVRSVDWIYTYLRSFYADDSRPWGVNNAVFKKVAMPHVLYELQGLQERLDNPKEEEANAVPKFKLVEKGLLTPEQYNDWVRDLVNFLNYVSEPSKLKRLALGKWVIGFLLVFWLVMYLLNKEFWKDVKRKA